MIFYLNGCNTNHSDKWCELETNGIPQSGHSFSDLIFLNNQEAYLVGYENSENNKVKAIIYSTKDGINWGKKLFEHGSFTKIVNSEAGVYTILISDKTHGSKVYKKDDRGEFQHLFSFPMGYIRDLFFLDRNNGYFLAKKNDSGKYYLYKTNNGGIDFTTISLNKEIGPTSLITKNYFYYVSYSNKSLTSPDLLIKINLSNLSEKVINLEKNCYFYCFNLNDNGDLFLVANRDKSYKKDSMTLWMLKLNENNITFLSNISLFSKMGYPVKVKAYKNEVLVITKDIGTKVYRSFDGGKTFIMENLEFSSLNPAYFINSPKDSTFYTYGYVNGIGIIQSDMCKTGQE